MDYSEFGFERVLLAAKEICEPLGIESEFAGHRIRRADRQSSASADQFKEKKFTPIVAVASNKIEERFETLHKHNTFFFSFLYNFKKYEEKRRVGSLLAACKNLETAHSIHGKFDIDGDDLFCELSVVSTLIKIKTYFMFKIF